MHFNSKLSVKDYDLIFLANILFSNLLGPVETTNRVRRMIKRSPLLSKFATGVENEKHGVAISAIETRNETKKNCDELPENQTQNSKLQKKSQTESPKMSTFNNQASPFPPGSPESFARSTLKTHLFREKKISLSASNKSCFTIAVGFLLRHRLFLAFLD